METQGKKDEKKKIFQEQVFRKSNNIQHPIRYDSAVPKLRTRCTGRLYPWLGTSFPSDGETTKANEAPRLGRAQLSCGVASINTLGI